MADCSSALKLERILGNTPNDCTRDNKFYLPCLDGLRACAFLLVFAAHAGLDKVVPGGFGVTVFFFLSGYLITSLLRLEQVKTGTISLRDFYLRRSLRILPPMYLTLAIGYILGHVGVLAHPGNMGGLASALLYYNNYIGLLHPGVATLPTGLGLVWSLMIEEHFYLLFPLLYLGFARLQLSRLTQGAVLGGLCTAALIWRCYLVFVKHLPITNFGWTYVASDCRFDSILWGCMLAIVTNPWFGDGGRWLQKLKGPLAGSGLALIVLTLLWRDPYWRETFRYTIQSVALYPIFYYCVASADNLSVRWLSSTPMRWLGWTSYSMYLVHMMVLSVLAMVGLHSVARGLFAFAISMAYATAMRLLVETPIRRLGGTKTASTFDRVVSVPA